MADIQAFRGLRYELSKVGSLSDVVAPPYDVIDAELQDQLYAKSPFNVTRLILNRGDDLMEGQTVHQRAAEHLKRWRMDGILTSENQGTIYVYHQTFVHEGQTFTRRGFMARVKLEPFGSGNIFPHEETHAHAKEDRFKLMTACRANLSQIFGVYPDRENEAQESLEAAIEDRTPISATDHLGVKHDLWLVTDPDSIAAAASVLGDSPMYIADGHHRYETACDIQAATREAGNLEGDQPCDYVLMMCVSMHDPGMTVLPTHRLFRGVDPISSADLTQKLGNFFDCEPVGAGPAAAGEIWDLIAGEEEQSLMAFYCRQDDQWVLARLNDAGMDQMNSVAPAQSDQWRELGVSILHKLVMEKLLGYDSLPSPCYAHEVSEVVGGLLDGDPSGRDATGQMGSGAHFELGCLVMPATVEHVKAISENGERMPAKSTYFYPKLLAGLVINPLDE